MPLDILQQTPVAPVYIQKHANEAINFGMHSIDFKVGEETASYEAELRLHFSPKHSLDIECSAKKDQMALIHAFLIATNYQFDSRNEISSSMLFSAPFKDRKEH